MSDDENSRPDHTFEVDVDESTLNDALKAVEQREAAAQPGPGASARVADLEAQVKALAEESAAHKDKYLRAVADLENFRKRALREKDEARLYGAENLLRDVVVVLDNLDRALTAQGDAEQIRQGVRMTQEQFRSILRQHGVEAVESVGAVFDPTRHEAVAHIETDAHPPGTVLEEHRKGYRFRERLLRPAMVSVAKAPAPQSGT